MGVLLALGVLFAAQTAAASWQDQTTPFPPGARTWVLAGVSCPQSTCEAVGSFTDNVGVHLLAERRSNGAWALQGIPDPAGSISPSFNDVSCKSASMCVAVGRYATSTTTVSLAEAWNGSSWTAQATPNPTGATTTELAAISCPTLTACIAVGDADASGSPQVLAERWNGASWSILSVPVPGGTTQSALKDVACTSATSCVAVGSFFNGTDTLTLAEVWNGSSWSIQSTPNPTGATFSELDGVSCTSASACTAVGFGFAERWNGTSWALQTIARPPGVTEAQLDRVSCTTPTACTAVGGYYDHEAVQQLVVEAWNGTKWQVQQAPITTSSDSSLLYDVFCGAPTSCTAVGSYHDPVTGDRSLAELEALRWQLQNTPQPNGNIGGSLDSVSCKPPNACAAIGDFETLSDFQTVAESFSANAWSEQSTPNPTTSNLSGVSCTAQTACTSVGDFLSGSDLLTLAERWDGTSWTIQSTPNPAGVHRNFLLAVSCPSATSCAAVGFADKGSGQQVTLAERWNGTTWSLQSTPNPTGTSIQLTAVSCPSTTACTAVGTFSGTPGIFAEIWNGSSWTLQNPPVPSGGSSPFLDGVSCTSATACTVVGQYFNAGKQIPLAERWDGTSWSVQTPAVPAGRPQSGFKGVSCAGINSCSAVGFARAGNGKEFMLAEHWNGTTWALQPVEAPAGTQGGWLNAISCPSLIRCEAVGFFTDNSGVDELLSEQYF
jgi:hypothetical protein